MRYIALISLFVTAACSDGASEAPAAAPEPAAPEPVAAPEPAAAPADPSGWLDAGAMQQIWAGSQVVGGRLPTAWDVQGTTVTQDDGSGAVTRTLEFRSPCDVAVKDEEAGSSTIRVFAVDGEDRYMGLGGAAVPVAEGEYLACVSGKHVHVTEDGCTVWKNRFGRWEVDDAEMACSMTEDAMTVGSNELERTGSVYLTVQMKTAKVVEHSDFASAQAAL